MQRLSWIIFTAIFLNSSGAFAAGLSALSFNMLHRDRPEELKIVAEHLQSDLPRLPDFLFLQEVMFNRTKNDGFNNTAQILASHLGYFSEGTKRSSDREGVAIVSKYPFQFYDSKTYKAQTSSILLGFKRVAVMGEFQVPEVGLVRVVDVHLTNWGFETRIRRKQIQETLEWIGAREKMVHADVILLGGDFNAEENSGEVKYVRDLNAAQGIAFQSFNSKLPTMSAQNPSKRIDLIFVASPTYSFELLEEKIIWKDGLPTADGRSKFWPSDHLLMYQNFNLKP